MKKLATCAAMTALLMFAGAGFLNAKTYVLPHVLETSGGIGQAYQYDTSLWLTYTSGLNLPAPAGGTATTIPGQGADMRVDVYLFGSDGSLLGATPSAPYCDPCSFTLNATARKVKVAFQDLITNNGGWTAQTVAAFAVVVVNGGTGSDADAVNMQVFTVNSHTGPKSDRSHVVL